MGSRDTPPPTTTTQRQEPPAFAVPGLTFAAEEAQRQFQAGPQQFFPGSTVVPFAPQTEQALQLTEQRALAGSPLVSAAQTTAQDIVEGRQINPFLAGAVQSAIAPIGQQFQEQILPDIRSSFASLGRSGGGREEAALQNAIRNFGRGVGNIGGQLAFGAAESEAGRQLQATQLAPGLAREDFADINRLLGVGQTREALEAAQLQEEINRFQFEQQAPGAALNDLINQLTGATAGLGTRTIQTPGVAQPSRFLTGAGGALGGAATGAALGSVVPFFGTGLGAALGGGIGLLGGLLS